MVVPVVNQTPEVCVFYLAPTKLGLKFQANVHVLLALFAFTVPQPPALVGQVTERTQCILFFFFLDRLRAMKIIALACVSCSHILEVIVLNAAHVLIIGSMSL